MMPNRTRPEGCLSEFALDRLMARDLEANERAHVEAHLASCARCARRHDELTRERDEFAAAALALDLTRRSALASPPAVLDAQAHDAQRSRAADGVMRNDGPKTRASVETRDVQRRRSWAAPMAAALAAAAVVAIVLARPSSDDSTRTKGSAARLGLYVSHHGAVRRASSPERVEPGDRIRFVVAAPEAVYLAVLSVDGARRASAYHPSGVNAARIEPGHEVALPSSTMLDDTLGDETIVGVFCPRSFLVEPLVRALEASPTKLPSPPGCAVDVLHLRKEAPGPP